jgi:ribosomal protein S18 acetylase RimI-like enzyme
MHLITVLEAQRPMLRRVLADEAADHLLLLAWAERLGRDPEVAFWAIAGQGGFTAILGRHGSDWGIANPGGADLYPLAKVLEKQGGRLRGRGEAVGPPPRHIGTKTHDQTSLLVGLPSGVELACPEAGTSRRLAPEDLAAAPPWLAGPDSLPVLKKAVAWGRVVALETEGRMVAAAWTEVESEGLAMIGDLRVAPEYRRRGWGRACLRSLCLDLLGDGLRPQMAYDCPILGRLAGEIGFAPQGRWRRILVSPAVSSSASPEDSPR